MPASRATISREVRKSTFENGSSSSRILGSFSNARASDIRCRMPWEYCPTGRARDGSSRTARIADATRTIRDPIQPRKIFQILDAAHFVIKKRGMRHVSDLVADIAKLLRPKD